MRPRTALAGIALLVAVGVVSIRVLVPLRAAGGPSVDVPAMSDFRDAIYNPVAAFLDGENPYDRATFARKYPGLGGIGLYSPLTLLLYLPVALFSLPTAALVYFFASLVGTIALAPLALHLGGVRLTAARALALAALLVASRPGHWNLFTGQVTLQAACGTYAALWYARSRPTAAGLGLALTTFKPTYGLPLAGLMLVRGDWRALGIGVAVAAIATGIVGAALVLTTGLEPVVASVAATYEGRAATPWKSPAVDPFRVDVVALVARGLGTASGVMTTLGLTAAVLGFASIGLRRLATRSDREARGLGVALGVLAIVTSTYHMQYDVVALAPLLAALLWSASDGPWGRRPQIRLVALGLLAIPFLNYLSSVTAARRMDLAPGTLLLLSSLNGGALLALLGLVGTIAMQEQPRSDMSGSGPEARPSGREPTVRLAGTGDDAEIFDCMRVCFDFDPDPARYHHLHSRNPAGPSLVALVRADGAVVSGVALLPRRASVFGREGMLGHVVDAMTRPGWRGRGLRSRATNEIRRLARERGSLGVFSFSNRLSLPGNLRQERRRAVADAPVLLRPIRPLAALARAASVSRPGVHLGLGRLPPHVPDSAVAGPLDAGATHLLEAARARPDWTTPSFDVGHERLFREIEGRPSIALLRDTAHLRWRYGDAPGSPYLQRDSRRGGRLEATLVARSIELLGLRLVLLMEWGWRPGARDEGVLLVRELVSLARDAGAHALSALAMPGTLQRRVLGRLGFLPVPGRLAPRRVVFNVAPDDEHGGSAWYRPESWYLSWGDGFLF